jgi:hypothetical protein
MALLEIATKAMAAINQIKADNPEAYEYVSKHHADALAAAEAANR